MQLCSIHCTGTRRSFRVRTPRDAASESLDDQTLSSATITGSALLADVRDSITFLFTLPQEMSEQAALGTRYAHENARKNRN